MFCLITIGVEVRNRESKMKKPVGIPDLRYWPLEARIERISGRSPNNSR